MKFLVDAQLPKQLAESLKWWGCDVIHTLDLPEANRTPDWRINDISIAEQRIVITKDADFVNSFMLSDVPYKLLLVSTGNLNNRELCEIFAKNLSAILFAFENHAFVEISKTRLIEHK